MKKLLFIIVIFNISCSSYDIYFSKNRLNIRTKNVVIGNFEKRFINYKPFTIANFKDAIRFEFFKLNYNSTLYRKSNGLLSKKEIFDTCKEYKDAVFIQGSVSEKESGNIIDNEVSVFITFLIYNNMGNKIGEAHYISNNSLSDLTYVKKISEIFTESLDEKIKIKPESKSKEKNKK